jgi:2,3-bisphosphoglycerate-independent phosphoglycerate mutase
MDIGRIWEGLVQREGGTIIYVVMDGLGGLPDPDKGGTEFS